MKGGGRLTGLIDGLTTQVIPYQHNKQHFWILYHNFKKKIFSNLLTFFRGGTHTYLIFDTNKIFFFRMKNVFGKVLAGIIGIIAETLSGRLAAAPDVIDGFKKKRRGKIS